MVRKDHVEVLAPNTTARERTSWVNRHVQGARNNRPICKGNRHPSRSQLSVEKPSRAELLHSRVGQGRLVAGEGRSTGRGGTDEVVGQAFDGEGGDEATSGAGFDETFGGRHCDDATTLSE